jgi:hypothetical protein
MSGKNVRLWLFLSGACSNVELEEGSLVLDVSSPPGVKTLLPGQKHGPR